MQNSLVTANPAAKILTVDLQNKSSALKAWTQAFDASDAPDSDMIQGMQLSDDLLRDSTTLRDEGEGVCSTQTDHRRRIPRRNVDAISQVVLR